MAELAATAVDDIDNETPKSDPSARPAIPGWTEFGVANSTVEGAGQKIRYGGSGAKYSFTGDHGDVLPRVPELEKILFGGDYVLRRGQHFENLDLAVTLEGPFRIKPIREFADAGLHPVMLDNIKLAQYGRPTPIQAYTIPAIHQGLDVVGIAQTGTGKTAAYMIPIINSLMGKAVKLQAPRSKIGPEGYDPRIHGVKAEPLVLIIVPTRELAIQVFDEARRMCYRSMLRPCVAYGGFPMGDLIADLGKGCDILIGTPGRLGHLMDKPDVLTMSRVRFTVIDEADELLNMDWSEDMTKLLGGGDANENGDHIFMLFSATFPNTVRALAREYMAEDHVKVKIGRAGSTHKNVDQVIVPVTRDTKREAIVDLLISIGENGPCRTLIFCNSKIAVDLLDDFLYNKGFPTTSIHSDRGQHVREDAMRSFREGKTPILIATAVSARGWDIANVNVVINYDFPSSMYGGIQEYVHRIGRTGRMGHKGTAYSFYDSERDEDVAQDLVNILAECESKIPDCLSHLTPQDGVIDFNDDSDDEGLSTANGETDPTDTVADAIANLNVNEGFNPDGDAAQAESSGWQRRTLRVS